MHTRLFLLRHGETQANIEQRYQGQACLPDRQGESALSELGSSEAKELATFLKKERFDAFYSSTLSRSHKTAKLIAEEHSMGVTQVPGLIERNYGEWENLKFDEIKKKYPVIYKRWLMNPGKTSIPKAESLKALQKRGVKAIERIVKGNKGKTICVVGHGGINRTILFHYMNIDLNNFWRIKQDNCCVNIIEFDRHPMVALLNSTAFLGEKRIKCGGYY